MAFPNSSWNLNGFLQFNQNSTHQHLSTTPSYSKKCLHDQILLLRKHGSVNTITKLWPKLPLNRLLERKEMAQGLVLLHQFTATHKESSYHVGSLQDILISMLEQWLLQPLTKQYVMQYVWVLTSIKWLDLTTFVGQIQLNQKRPQMVNSNSLNLFEPIVNWNEFVEHIDCPVSLVKIR